MTPINCTCMHSTKLYCACFDDERRLANQIIAGWVKAKPTTAIPDSRGQVSSNVLWLPVLRGGYSNEFKCTTVVNSPHPVNPRILEFHSLTGP